MFYFMAYFPYPNIQEINGVKVKLMVQFYVRFGELLKKNKGILEFCPYFFKNLAIYQCFETNQVHAPEKKKRKKKKLAWNLSSCNSSSIPIAAFSESYSSVLNGTRAL